MITDSNGHQLTNMEHEHMEPDRAQALYNVDTGAANDSDILTNGELIAHLQQFPADADVFIAGVHQADCGHPTVRYDEANDITLMTPAAVLFERGR
jgi:hypothetical protein